jgi:hypothetical protein
MTGLCSGLKKVAIGAANAKGDAIQFCRDFLGLSFHAACLKAQLDPTEICRPKPQTDSPPSKFPLVRGGAKLKVL